MGHRRLIFPSRPARTLRSIATPRFETLLCGTGGVGGSFRTATGLAGTGGAAAVGNPGYNIAPARNRRRLFLARCDKRDSSVPDWKAMGRRHDAGLTASFRLK